MKRTLERRGLTSEEDSREKRIDKSLNFIIYIMNTSDTCYTLTLQHLWVRGVFKMLNALFLSVYFVFVQICFLDVWLYMDMMIV